MVGVDVALRVRLEDVAVNGVKERVVRIEHLLGEDLIPLASDAASIHTYTSK